MTTRILQKIARTSTIPWIDIIRINYVSNYPYVIISLVALLCFSYVTNSLPLDFLHNKLPFLTQLIPVIPLLIEGPGRPPTLGKGKERCEFWLSETESEWLGTKPEGKSEFMRELIHQAIERERPDIDKKVEELEAQVEAKKAELIEAKEKQKLRTEFEREHKKQLELEATSKKRCDEYRAKIEEIKKDGGREAFNALYRKYKNKSSDFSTSSNNNPGRLEQFLKELKEVSSVCKKN